MTSSNQSQSLSRLHNRIARIREESASLKQSLEKLRSGADLLSDPSGDQQVCAYWMEPDGTIVAASQALVRLLGFASVDELRARRPDDGEYDMAHVEAMFARHGGHIKDIESVWRRKDGSIVHVRESARAIYDAQGRPVSYEGVIEEVGDGGGNAPWPATEVAPEEPAAGRPPAWTETIDPSTRADERLNADQARFQPPAAQPSFPEGDGAADFEDTPDVPASLDTVLDKHLLAGDRGRA